MPQQSHPYRFHRQRRRKKGRQRKLDTATGRTERILAASRPVAIGISLSPDLRKIYFTQVDAEESDLMLVRGFR